MNYSNKDSRTSTGNPINKVFLLKVSNKESNINLEKRVKFLITAWSHGQAVKQFLEARGNSINTDIKIEVFEIDLSVNKIIDIDKE